MISKYCVIASSLGFEQKHCNSCKNNQFYLIDRMNYSFPLICDDNCNMIVLNSKALHLLSFVDEIYDLGINSIRLDFTIESKEETYNITSAYIDKINKKDSKLNIKDVTYGYYLDNEKN